jgi:protein-disulfide isomerase
MGLSAHGASLFAQGDSAAGQTQPAPSVQQQLDDLKRGQEQILKQLEEIKAQLRENVAKSESAAKVTPTNIINMNVHGEPFRGDSHAPFAVIEYADFTCSFCGRYAREVYPKLDQEFIRPGKVKYFFRDLPAPDHPASLTLARAARCAGEQGKFWEMHDWLFAMQATPESTNALAQATGANLDLDSFQACLAAGKYAENIRRSVLTARRAGIYGIPAFVIGTVSEEGDLVRSTKVLVGMESAEELQSALAELLASKRGQ